MAVKTFDEIYAQLSADERKLLDSVFAKEPELKGGWTRQDDYSRKTQELAAERKKNADEIEYAARMKAWADENVPKYDALVAKGVISEDGEDLWAAQKAELESQLAVAKAAGVDMDPKELDKIVRGIVKENGGLTPEELKAVIANEGAKLVAEGFAEQWKTKEADFNTKTIPFVAGFSAATAVLASKFERETGEPWTADKQKELFDLMAKEQNFDPFVVGEKMLAPAKEKKTRESEIKAEVDRQVAEARKNMPGGGHDDYIPQDGQKGSLQMALERSQDGGDFESVIKARAVEAAKALTGEGKG